ncbi:MAG: hypothetical protein GXP25_17225 [Planctomycetes bacterium]|nr:hypothetical protein [Planctomycetota bacterium]
MRRIHRRLLVEELEPRVAPVTLSAANSIQYFTDTDGDQVMVRYMGTGTAHVLFGGGESPNPADEIATIDLAGSDEKTQLIIQDVEAGAGGDTLSGGTITGQAGEAMGTIQLLAKDGAVNTTAISVDGYLKSLTVKGNASGVDLNTTGDTASVSFDGSATNCDIVVNGSLSKASFKQDLTGGMIDVGVALSRLNISGSVSGTAISAGTDLLSASVRGDFLGGASISALGISRSVTVSGAVDNAVITANNIQSFRAGSLSAATITGTTGLSRAQINGAMTASRIVSGGDSMMFSVKGDVTNTTSLVAPFDVTGNLKKLMVQGKVVNTPGGATPFVSVTGDLGGLFIKGDLTNTAGPINHVDVGGSLGPAMIFGSVSNTRITPTEAMAFTVRGDFDNSEYILGSPTSTKPRRFMCFGSIVNGSNIDITGQFGMFVCKGGMTDSQVHISGKVSSFQVTGAVSNTPITLDDVVKQVRFARDLSGSNVTLGNGTSMFRVQGRMQNDTISITGDVGQFNVMGDVDPTTITLAGDVRMLVFRGDVTDLTLTVTGATSQARMQGAVTTSTLSLNGGGDFVRLYGPTTDADVTVGGALRTLYTGAVLGVGSNLVINGDLTMAQLRGGMGGGSLTVNGNATRVSCMNALTNGSSLDVNGVADRIQLKGGILTGSSVTFTGDVNTVQVQGPKVGACIDATSSLTVASVLKQFSIRGAVFGAVTVTGSLVAGAKMQFSDGLAGVLTFTNDVDAPVTISGDIKPGGSVRVGGDVTTVGSIIISGSVNTPGETSIDITGSVYGAITISGAHQGLLNVDGNVSGILQAPNFDHIDIGVHATETGDLIPGGQVIATGPPGTINSIIVHGRCYGIVSDTTHLEEHNPLQDVFILNPGETESYADADGDYMVITYNGDVGSSVQVTMNGAGNWRDIASLVYTNANSNTALDISCNIVIGGGWTNVATVDATGQTIGDLHIDGSIGALTADAIAAGNTVTTWSADSNGGMGTVTIANDIAGALEIGGSVTNQIILGGGIASTGKLIAMGVPSGEGHRGPNAPLLVGGAIDPAAELAVVKPGTYTGTGKVYIENVVDTPVLATVDLYNLAYSYKLTGAYARVKINEHTNTFVTRPNNDYTDIGASDWELSEVCAYYYVDRFHSYLAFLGYGDKWDRAISMTVNIDEDNAYYLPSSHSMEFGMPEGADVSHTFATDGDTVVHEYSHAWTDEMISGKSLAYGNDISDFSGAIDEALADYRSASFFDDSLLFEPDDPIYWRDMSNTDKYPYDINVYDGHHTGPILGGAFWDLRAAVGMTAADTLSLAMLPYLENIGTTGADGLEAVFDDVYLAVVQADNALYGGAHAADIATAFNAHGINVAPDATLTPGQSTNFVDSDGDTVTVTYTGATGSVEVYLDGPGGAHTGVGLVYSNPSAASQVDISADGSGDNRTPPASLFSAYGVVFGSATVEGPIVSIGSGVVAAGESISNTSAGADGDLHDFFNGGVLAGAVSIGGDLTGRFDLDDSLSGTLNVGGTLSGAIVLGSSSHWAWVDITDTGRVNIGGDISGAMYIYGYVDGQIDCNGDVTGTADTDFLYVEGSVWDTGVVNIDGVINDRDITIDIDMLGGLYAGRFGDVSISGYFEGHIGDAGTAAGIDNTLDVGATYGGVVTPGNAFTHYYGYP